MSYTVGRVADVETPTRHVSGALANAPHGSRLAAYQVTIAVGCTSYFGAGPAMQALRGNLWGTSSLHGLNLTSCAGNYLHAAHRTCPNWNDHLRRLASCVGADGPFGSGWPVRAASTTRRMASFVTAA